jgi:putative ABC transport system ATP-binding protein
MLEVLQVAKRYQSSVPVLRHVSFSLPAGALGVVIGRSGSGKSTLLSLIAGLDTVDSGTITIDSKRTSDLSAEEFARFRLTSLGIVFQFFNLLPTLTLARNVALPGFLLGTKRHRIDERVAELLSLVGLSDKGHHFPHEASGGENQRAAIARALFHSPRLLLADEPTGNLDRENGEAIITLFRTLAHEHGQSALIVTHDPHLITAADYVFRLEEGCIQ